MKRGMSSQWILISLWIITLIGALAVWGLIRNQVNASERLVAQLKIVQQEVTSERWPAALEEIKDVRSTWEDTRKRWALHTDHTEMDIITDALVDAEAKIHLQDTGAYASVSLAIDRIKTLPERDFLVLENLF